MPRFKYDPNADINRTRKLAQIRVIPSKLVARFGPPAEGDGYKVSGTYTFTSDEGHLFTVYDWKETALCDDELEKGEESEAPTPERFWAGTEPIAFCIGGHEMREFNAFKAWLTQELQG